MHQETQNLPRSYGRNIAIFFDPIFLTLSAILLFLLMGSAFLIFPDQHYNTSSPITYTRYGILGGLLAGGCVYYWKHPLTSEPLRWALLWWCAILLALPFGADPLRAALYALPAFALFIPPNIHERLPGVLWIVFACTILGTLYELSVSYGFLRFSALGFRASSIFINPNNLAMALTIICAYLVERSDTALKIAILTVCTSIVYLSGSKLGLILAGLLIVHTIWISRPRLTVSTLIVMALAIAGLLLTDRIRAPLASIQNRLEQLFGFFGSSENFVFPTLNSLYVYVDNAYVQTWNELGIPATVVFIAALVFTAARDRLKSPLWMLFAAASVAENINYLWPIGYFFWAHVGRPGRNSDANLLDTSVTRETT